MKDARIIFLLIVLASVLYGLTLRGVVGTPSAVEIRTSLERATMPFELSPERGRYVHVMALVEDGTYSLSKDLALVAYPDVGYSGDRYYSFFAPGIAYMAAPFYRIGAALGAAQLGTYAFVSLASIAALVMLYIIARQVFALPRPIAFAIPVMFGFGTTAWGYAITLYQHHITTLLLLVAFYCIWRYRIRARAGFFWGGIAWLCYGIAIFIDYPNALLFLPMIAYLVGSAIQTHSEAKRFTVMIRPAMLLASVVFVVVMGFHFVHNAQYFGLWARLSGGLPNWEPALLENEMPVVGALEPQTVSFDKDVIGFFSEESVPRGLYTLLISPDRGLFLFAPLFVVSLFGVAYSLRRARNAELFALLGTVAMNVFLYSSWGDPWGGWAYGPRYLIPSMALLTLFIGLWLANAKRPVLAKVLTLLLFAVSAGIAVLGALTTNAVPPYHEAIRLENLYNYKLNLRFLAQNMSSSVMYNTMFREMMSLKIYLGMLYAFVIAVLTTAFTVKSRYDD